MGWAEIVEHLIQMTAARFAAIRRFHPKLLASFHECRSTGSVQAIREHEDSGAVRGVCPQKECGIVCKALLADDCFELTQCLEDKRDVSRKEFNRERQGPREFLLLNVLGMPKELLVAREESV